MRSIYAVACSAMVMLSAFTACDNSNDSFEYSPEQLAYFEKNREYIREKKKEKDANGELVYQELVKYGDTTLYRIIDSKGSGDYPLGDRVLKFRLEGHLIDGTNFQKDDTMRFAANNLIYGLRGVVLETAVGDSVEAIMPASLAYGYQDYGSVVAGSTLIFRYRAENIQ